MAKLEYDYGELTTAVMIQEETRIGHTLVNFAIWAYHIKDWLKRHKPRSYTAKQVEDHVASSVALSSCRDICNAGKHVVITQYDPSTTDVTASVTPVDAPGGSVAGTPILRVKIVRKDGSRHDVLELAEQAIQDWVTFFEKHKV